MNAGATFTELAEKYGLSRQRVSEIYATFGTRKAVDLVKPKEKVGVQAAKSGLSMEEWRHYSRLGAIRAFNEQRRNAEARGVGWEITIHEWWGLWLESGKWAERGRGKGQYVMARTGDSGPYKIGNVRITTSDDNIQEAATRRGKSKNPRRRRLRTCIRLSHLVNSRNSSAMHRSESKSSLRRAEVPAREQTHQG